MSGMARTAAIILAAGLGTRMRSALPKALHPIAGRPMLRHLIAACEAVFERIVVVVGPGMPALEAAAAPHPTVVQAERLGTGHAALQAAQGRHRDQRGVGVEHGGVPPEPPQRRRGSSGRSASSAIPARCSRAARRPRKVATETSGVSA